MVRASLRFWEIFGSEQNTTPRPSKRDRGATPDSEFLPNCIPLTFCGFLTRSKSDTLGKELYRTVTTQTSYDTCGSVVRDTSLEVCRVHAHFSEPCGGACCAGDLFLPGGSSTRWAPPRFDTRIGDLACTIQYIGLTSSFLTIVYNKIERNAIGIVKNMIFLKKGMGDTVQCAKCDRDVTGVV